MYILFGFWDFIFFVALSSSGDRFEADSYHRFRFAVLFCLFDFTDFGGGCGRRFLFSTGATDWEHGLYLFVSDLAVRSVAQSVVF